MGTSLARSMLVRSSAADEVDGAGWSEEFACILWHTSNACPTVRTILIAWLCEKQHKNLLKLVNVVKNYNITCKKNISTN